MCGAFFVAAPDPTTSYYTSTGVADTSCCSIKAKVSESSLTTISNRAVGRKAMQCGWEVRVAESQSRRVAGRRQAGRWGRRLALVGRASEFRPPSLWGSFQPFWGKKGCAGYRHHGEPEGRTTLGTPTAARFECRGGSGVRMEFRLEKLVEKRKRILI
jgi:hypothetical protein